MIPFDRSHMTSYSHSIVTLVLSVAFLGYSVTYSTCILYTYTNSQLQLRATLAEASRGLSKNCEAGNLYGVVARVVITRLGLTSAVCDDVIF